MFKCKWLGLWSAVTFFTALPSLAAFSDAYYIDPNQWAGKSPMTLIGDRNFIENAKFWGVNLYDEVDKSPTTNWGAVTKVSLSWESEGMRPADAYYFWECSARCMQGNAPAAGWLMVDNVTNFILLQGYEAEDGSYIVVRYTSDNMWGTPGGWSQKIGAGKTPNFKVGRPALEAQSIFHVYLQVKPTPSRACREVKIRDGAGVGDYHFGVVCD